MYFSNLIIFVLRSNITIKCVLSLRHPVQGTVCTVRDGYE